MGKVDKKAYNKAYYEKNKEKIKARKKAYYEKNKEKLNAYNKAYHENNKEKMNARSKAYKKNNKEKIKAYNKAYHENNREKRVATAKVYYEKNKEKIKAYNKAYGKAHREQPEVKKKHNKYRVEWRKSNPTEKRKNYLREKLRKAVIYQRNFISTIHKLIGCDVPTARAHLEAQFEPWMNWENYGRERGKWNIDHIIRLSSIDIFNEEEVKRIFHYTNMRPLCSIKNAANDDEGR